MKQLGQINSRLSPDGQELCQWAFTRATKDDVMSCDLRGGGGVRGRRKKEEEHDKEGNERERDEERQGKREEQKKRAVCSGVTAHPRPTHYPESDHVSES
jgi:hypothetical protein